MKKYKVLEAHQGDKFYQPGDGETGTRIADPNAVGHLVTLGLLEEIGDVVADEPAKNEAGASVADLQAQLVALTQERDDARADLTALGSTYAVAQNAATSLRDQVEALTTERDDLREQLTAKTTEQDGLFEQLTTVTTERDDLRVQLTTANDERAASDERAKASKAELDALTAASVRPTRNR